MRNLLIVIGALLFSISLLLLSNLRITMIQLSEQYTTLGALDYWKDMKTNMERKDGAYNFVYCHNAIGIIETRKTYIGRLVSNWVEMKKPKLKQYRIEAEKYINLHMDSYVVRPDQRSGPKIEILIE